MTTEAAASASIPAQAGSPTRRAEPPGAEVRLGLYETMVLSRTYEEAILRDYFGLPVEVRQFQGQWLRLDPANQSRVGALDGHSLVGQDLVAGERVWDVQSKLRIRLGPLTRLGGRISAANVAFDDHPNEKRFSDRIETVTVDSVFAWLSRSGMAARPVQFAP